ncbi:hypothetical protein V8J82_19320 [Gymnodinialimonas sp. 2305UL16-5]|uniref:hypothetical protein n=1 Tax=Gymnodinialimonas mytili TaxID=3126503 RepID=UPI0030B47CE7
MSNHIASVDDEISVSEFLKHIAEETLHLAALTERLDQTLGAIDEKAIDADADFSAALQNMDYVRQGVRAVGVLTKNLSACLEAQPDAVVSRATVSAGVGPKNILDNCLLGPEAMRPTPNISLPKAVPGDFIEF